MIGSRRERTAPLRQVRTFVLGLVCVELVDVVELQHPAVMRGAKYDTKWYRGSTRSRTACPPMPPQSPTFRRSSTSATRAGAEPKTPEPVIALRLAQRITSRHVRLYGAWDAPWRPTSEDTPLTRGAWE